MISCRPSGRLVVRDVVAQELPPLGMAHRGVGAGELAIDDVESLDRRQLVLQAGEAEVRRAAR